MYHFHCFIQFQKEIWYIKHIKTPPLEIHTNILTRVTRWFRKLKNDNAETQRTYNTSYYICYLKIITRVSALSTLTCQHELPSLTFFSPKCFLFIRPTTFIILHIILYTYLRVLRLTNTCFKWKKISCLMYVTRVNVRLTFIYMYIKGLPFLFINENALFQSNCLNGLIDISKVIHIYKLPLMKVTGTASPTINIYILNILTIIFHNKAAPFTFQI